MTTEHLLKLFQQYTLRTNSPEEEEELMLYIANPASEKQVMLLLNELVLSAEEGRDLAPKTVNGMLEIILGKEQQLSPQPVPTVHRTHFLRTAWFRYAAAILLLLLGTGSYLWFSNKKTEIAGNQSIIRPVDVPPGGNKAILTLADGSTILLDNINNGNIAQQGNTQIIKLESGQLTYQERVDGEPAGGVHTSPVSYNTITTPRGGQYQIVLPDGSKVWLNAASSIKFPTTFVGDARNVEITGEAYLEIEKNAKQPFLVKANSTEVQVLGTSFNINAYPDEEAVKTTLIEGSVRVKWEGESRKSEILKPGSQARLFNNQLSVVNNIAVDDVIAWKNGFFIFKDVKIQPIMRQLARWYNLNIVYEGEINTLFYATIPRNVPISQVLKALELTKAVHFTIEGNNVVVKKT